MGQLNSSPLKFCLSRLKQISRELEFGSTQFLATLVAQRVAKGQKSPVPGLGVGMSSGIWEFRVSGGVADSGSFYNHAFAKQTRACRQTSKSYILWHGDHVCG